ncbi:hypothetical protein AVEN_153656-1 [Araneus ventricosus]|uniref:Endonuclease/exonuclease/phosphatase domain-containing protein n=1 Tax=Araneus ventricosus TaxID=182803 RepID=A0A4Y2BNX1_ARAVE|nr:hypothetical protein AVEN_153656-1 [Araneus ventricosus]
MTFVQWNCRGLKKIWLKVPPFSTSEFWVFQETFPKHEDHLLCSSKNYFYLDRQGRPSGGLLTAIPKNASGGIIPTGFSHNSNQEILAVEVHFKDFHFIIINLYAPQGLNIESVKYFFDSFSIPVFIFGDFNLHHPLWGSDRSSPLSNDFVEWLQNSSFILLNSSNSTYAAYTGSASLLDLSICSASISHAVNCYVSDSNFESDHYPVIITWSILDHTPKKIKSIDWNLIMSKSATVLATNTRLNALTSKISEVIRDNTKIVTLPAKNYPPWWNLFCHNFQKLKILFRKRALRLISESDWIKHKKYAAKLRFHIKKASRNYWDKICNISKNPRMFYSMLNRIYNHTNQAINTVILILHNNRYISNPVQQSNLFADFFSDNSMKHEPIPLDYCEDCNSHLNIPIHLQEVRQAIQKTRNSTPGVDGITANWFKRLNHISKKLQNTMENVYKWCNYWKLNISHEKCSIADLSKKKLQSIARITYAGFPLPWKQTIKYLGINFSKTNQNGVILKTIRSKALRKINALKSIAYKNYGPRTKDLINIANNSICSLFYYSCSITNKFSETQYKACNTIQTMALRVALGLPKWIPNIVIMKIAGQDPDSKEGCGKVAISLSIGCPRKHFRENRLGNHCRKVYIGKLFMNYLTDKRTFPLTLPKGSTLVMETFVTTLYPCRRQGFQSLSDKLSLLYGEVLSEKIKRLAAQFFIRQLANGVYSPIYDQNCKPSIKLIKRDEVMFSNLFTDLDTSTDHIIAFPDTLISRNNFCEIFLSDFSFQNKAHPAFLIKDLFEEVVYKEFQDFHIIATDASKSHSFTSIAGISNLQSFVYRIHPINSIFTAEALAICQALDELSVTDKNLL